MSLSLGKLAPAFLSLSIAPGMLFGQSIIASPRLESAGQIKPIGARAATAIYRPNASRIPLHADFHVRLRLSGHLPAWVATASDVAAAPAETVLHLDFVLTRAPDAQSAFDQLLDDQQTPGSPMYHAWLKPQQIGELFGPAQADLDVLVTWLTQQGFHIDEVAPSRLFVRVSAPAPVAAAALGTSFRMLIPANVPGTRARLSATSEPEVPAALAVLVGSIAGLTEVLEEPQHRMEIVPAEPPSAASVHPGYTSSSTGNHYIAPGDFSVLYDVPSVYDGTGQKVAIIGRSQVNPADITNFQASVGLASKLPNVIIPPMGADPGLSPGDQGEATLDVQRVAGTAPGAQADLVIASNASGGLRTAIQYNVQTLLDPIMTISFGACEASAGAANVNLYTQLFSQAAAEGISVFVSSGDSGAAGCDAHGVAPPATQIASINYICSSGFATCVGGTEFAADFTNPAGYWTSTNSATRESALTYIPEGAWNQPSSVDATTGATVYDILATGGGVSTYTSKPAFQTGNGVPADGFRDTPDISFSSAGHDPYFGCYAQTGGGNCVRDPTTGLFSYVGFYGTSAAAPGMAGVTALLNQKLGSAQGNLNPLIYRLANGTAANVFHDTTVASSGVATCAAAVPSLCNNSTPSPTALTGGLAGYLLTPGYDLATGWGSLDVANLLSAAAGTGVSTTTTLTGTSGNIQLTTPTVSFQATVAASTGSGTPTGTIQFFANGKALGAPATLASGMASLSLPNNFALGSYLITASYSGDATFDPSNSAILTFAVVPGTAPDMISLTDSTPGTTAAQVTILPIAVTPASPGSVPTGNIILSQLSNGSLLPIETLTLINGAAAPHITFGAGTYVLVASYPGDATYAAAASPPLTIVSARAPTVTTLSGTLSVPSGGTETLAAAVAGLPFLVSTTDTVTFFDGAAVLGSALLVPTGIGMSGATFTTAALTSGSHSFTATFSGDNNTLPSTSAAFVVTVAAPPGIRASPAASSLTLAAGATQGNTDLLTFTSVGGFTGTVALTCAVTYNGTGTATLPPTCSFSGNSATLAAAGTATSTLTVATTLPQVSGGTPQARNHVPSFYRTPGTLTAAFALLLAGLPFASRTRRIRKGWTLFLLLIGFSGLLVLAGCGGSTPTPTPTPVKVGTSTGSYTVVVTATGTSGATSVSLTIPIALTVQ